MTYKESYLASTNEDNFVAKVSQDLSVAALLLGNDEKVVHDIKEAAKMVATEKGYALPKEFRL